jgi:hypothetical protein
VAMLYPLENLPVFFASDQDQTHSARLFMSSYDLGFSLGDLLGRDRGMVILFGRVCHWYSVRCGCAYDGAGQQEQDQISEA